MKLQLGETIKSLRLQQQITQEQLAEVLGVTCQSVSRWELGICYPDMELLPMITNYFNVTADELLGMPAIRSEARHMELFTMILDLERVGDWPAAIHALRDACRLYPHDDGFRSELALALSKTHNEQDLEEAITLSEAVLAHCTNEKIRSTTRANLCFLYKASGQPQKAIDLGRTLPHIWECREMLLPDLVPPDDRADVVAQSMNIAQQVLRDIETGAPIPFSLGYRAN